MATTATLTNAFEYKDEPKSATLAKGWIYGYADFLLSGFEYVKAQHPKFFTYLIPDD